VRKVARLLIINRAARAVDDGVEAKLRARFPDHLAIDFNPRRDFERLITPRAQVVVAGGDGTVENVVRKLADTQHPLGVIPLGSFNNFALALGLPVDLDRAIRVVQRGRPRAITLGRVNNKVFLEACAIGLFGEAIVLGDSAKDLHFGDVVTGLRQVIEAGPFDYELTGDLRGRGTAMSLVFANTSSIGSQLPVSAAKPVQPYLELSVEAGQSHADIVGRVLASALLAKHEEGSGRILRFKKVSVRTRPRVRIYADNQPAGRTPATISAEVSALKVILPVLPC
jgi:diacylglycerol kinase (ATP)